MGGARPHISLPNGLFALVDDEDFERISKYRWSVYCKPNGLSYASRYCRIDGKRKTISMQAEIMGSIGYDHINRDGLDNRKSNLRKATHAENQRNRKSPIGESGFKGVRLRGTKWYAAISIDKRRFGSGKWLTPELAAREYDRMAAIYHGEFALTNKMLGLLP